MSGLPLVNEISLSYQGHPYHDTIWSGPLINFHRLTMKLEGKYPLQITLQSLSQILNQTITDAKYEEFNFCMLFSKKDGKVGN